MPKKKKTLGQLLAAKRTVHAGGRPAKPSACSKCGKPCASAREAKSHCAGKPRRKERKAEMTIEQVFDQAKILDDVKLYDGDRLLKLELQPKVVLLTGIHPGGLPWDSTMTTVDFAIDSDDHSETARRAMFKRLGMRGLKDFFLAYSVHREKLMARFKK